MDDEVADAEPELQSAPAAKPDSLVMCMLALSYEELSDYMAHGQATVYEN